MSPQLGVSYDLQSFFLFLRQIASKSDLKYTVELKMGTFTQPLPDTCKIQSHFASWSSSNIVHIFSKCCIA